MACRTCSAICSSVAVQNPTAALRALRIVIKPFCPRSKFACHCVYKHLCNNTTRGFCQKRTGCARVLQVVRVSAAQFMSASLQVFYAMCQGLLYAFCYHLDSLLDTADDSDCLTPSRLQSIHISDTAKPAVAAHSASSSMQSAGLRQTLSELLPQILHHR